MNATVRRIFVIAALVVTLGTPVAATAYEGDHYAWTYYLALQTGFTKRQALQIASGAYALDWDPDTGPMEASKGDAIFGANHLALGFVGRKNERLARIWTNFHCFVNEDLLDGCDFELETAPGVDYVVPCTSAVRAKVEQSRQQQRETWWSLAERERNPGVLLHYIQDYQAHFPYDNLRGHALAGHLPDFLSADPKKAEAATDETLAVLARFMEHLRSKKKVNGILPTPRKPDRARIKAVLEKLYAANPAPFNPLLFNPGEKPGDWIPAADPKLLPSINAIDQAVREDEEAGRFYDFPKEFPISATLPKKWIEYDYDGSGHIHTGPREVDSLELEWLPEKVEVVPVDAANVRVKLTLPYRFGGVLPLEAGGGTFLSPVPVLESWTFSDVEEKYQDRPRLEEREDGVYEIVKEIERSRRDYEAGTIVWSVSVQPFGYPPQTKSVPVKERIPPKVPSWTLVATRVESYPKGATDRVAKFEFGYPKVTGKYEFHLSGPPPSRITAGIPFTIKSWGTAARESDEAGIDYQLSIRYYRDEEGNEAIPWEDLDGQGTMPYVGENSETETWTAASEGHFVIRPKATLPDVFQIRILVHYGMGIEPHQIDWVTWVYRKER